MRLVEGVDAVERLALIDAVADLLECLDAGALVDRRAGGARQPVEPQAIDRFDEAVARSMDLCGERAKLGCASGRALRVDDLVQTGWVLREKGSGTRAVFEAVLAQSGLGMDALRVALELPSNEAVRAAVESGGAASVLSASVVAASIEAGLLNIVRFALPERDFCVLLHKERHLSRAAQAFLETVRHQTKKRRL